MDFEYSSIEKALEDLRAGKVILVTDDPERENEGDMICAAEFATTENINLMAMHARGLICTPKIPVTARRRLPWRSTMWTRRPVFLPQSGALRCANAQRKARGRKIFADPVMYFRWLREAAASSQEADIPRQLWI